MSDRIINHHDLLSIFNMIEDSENNEHLQAAMKNYWKEKFEKILALQKANEKFQEEIKQLKLLASKYRLDCEYLEQCRDCTVPDIIKELQFDKERLINALEKAGRKFLNTCPAHAYTVIKEALREAKSNDNQ